MKKLLILVALFPFAIFADEDVFNFSTASILDVPVFYVAPNRINKDTRLVVVMHGRKRNAEEYRDQWVDYAKELNLVVIVPEFSEDKFPGVHTYNYGNVFNADGQKQSIESRLFSLIEPLVKESLNRFKVRSDHWGIYGHGAGAHFVHRYVIHNPQSSYTLAIAANLGWYLTMTDKDWPFGLNKSGISDTMLKDAFNKYFLLMLGMSDVSTKPNTPYVASIFDKVTDQGKHRLERGRNFFNGVLMKSKELDAFLKWGLVEVPTKDGHSNTKQMVPFAAELFYERLK
ncbi:MAG: hypothetical protein DBW96_03595 [SAR86 cluster bacterium]|uniref:Alpha/beta hydrolase n=1 Tax=SAR86 cluster bacterium TaxID=2030880 RepID=A0A368BTY3_9GAMM|nr:MAG: hypothetical protein DBW96_03595 [SAR86 cluster bacterium]